MKSRGSKLGNGKATCKRDEIHPKRLTSRRAARGEANFEWHFKGKMVTSHHEWPFETLESRLLVSNIIRINPSRNRGHKKRLNDIRYSSVGRRWGLKIRITRDKELFNLFRAGVASECFVRVGSKKFFGGRREKNVSNLAFRSGTALAAPSNWRSRRLILNRLESSVKIGMQRDKVDSIPDTRRRDRKPQNEILKCIAHNASSDSVNSLRI